MQERNKCVDKLDNVLNQKIHSLQNDRGIAQHVQYIIGCDIVVHLKLHIVSRECTAQITFCNNIRTHFTFKSFAIDMCIEMCF